MNREYGSLVFVDQDEMTSRVHTVSELNGTFYRMPFEEAFKEASTEEILLLMTEINDSETLRSLFLDFVGDRLPCPENYDVIGHKAGKFDVSSIKNRKFKKLLKAIDEHNYEHFPQLVEDFIYQFYVREVKNIPYRPFDRKMVIREFLGTIDVKNALFNALTSANLLIRGVPDIRNVYVEEQDWSYINDVVKELKEAKLESGLFPEDVKMTIIELILDKFKTKYSVKLGYDGDFHIVSTGKPTPHIVVKEMTNME
jgi:hypothetical protein